MRCQIFRRTLWSSSGGIFNRPWFDSIYVIFIVYFAVLINNSYSASSSDGCVNRRNESECTCSNNHTKAVRCLTKGLETNRSCKSSKGNDSYRFFCEVMSQFDCTTQYSVKWDCSDCLVAYTNWLIRVISVGNATCLLKCITQTESIQKLCEDVLAKCPYLAPLNGYGNLPAFDCS